MSVTFHYFFNHPKSISELAQDINSILGCNLKSPKDKKDYMFCRFMGANFYFGDSFGFENDGDLDFENYQYNISIKVFAPDFDLLCVCNSLLAIIACVLFIRLKVTEGMLVHELQTLVARYKYFPNRGTIDLVSRKVVEYPEHFIELEQRIVS
ncbi:hypothetical protein [Myxosarcina sp. GI1]|uniref:hypothetical protein n=1 Tax=Myxosarcina sp. GI1 TaxID=1541065 RepID=UPI00055D526B|nr:hypothetical protein [Myxosarcina sp. GI1]